MAHEIVHVTKLHVIGPEDDLLPTRKTYLIREHRDGSVDIVESTRAFCEADSSAVFRDLVLEVESG
jgi:hypothetical protein